MAYLDVLDAAQAVCADVAGIVTAHQLSPEAAPLEASLPATVQDVGTIALSYTASQEIRQYEWPIYVLYEREGDNQAETEALLPLIEAVIVAFRSQTQHGLPNLYELRPTTVSAPGGISFLSEDYLGVTVTMTAKEKIPADFT